MSELPAGWVATDLESVAAWGSGGTPKAGTPAYYGGEIPWAVIGDLTDGPVSLTQSRITKLGLENSSAKVVDPDCVLVAMYGSIGKLGLPTIPLATNQAIAFAQPRRGISRKFLFYYLMAQRATLASNGKGATQQNISQTILRSWPFPLPPTAEQERIVAAIEEQFSRLDVGVSALERVRQNVYRLRAAVLQSGVTGELVPQVESEGNGEQLLATIHVSSNRRASTTRSELVTRLPMLPSSWATARWASVGLSQNGRAFPSSEYVPVGRRLLRPGNLDNSGKVVWTTDNTRCMPETYATKFPDYLVGPDEIVMNLTAQSLKDEFLGRVCMTDSGDAVLLNQRLARLTPFGVHPRFVFWVLKSPIFRRFVDQLNTGSLIQHMFTSQLDEFVLPVPPLAEQLRIVARVEEILGGLATVEEAISKTLRRGIVARSSIFVAAFSGKLVSQNPADEPATSLLDRIAADRESDSGPRRTKMPARTRSQRIARTKVTA